MDRKYILDAYKEGLFSGTQGVLELVAKPHDEPSQVQQEPEDEEDNSLTASQDSTRPRLNEQDTVLPVPLASMGCQCQGG